MFYVITIGAVSVLLCMVTESKMARRQKRTPEPVAALVSGAIGISYFIAMLYMTDVL